MIIHKILHRVNFNVIYKKRKLDNCSREQAKGLFSIAITGQGQGATPFP